VCQCPSVRTSRQTNWKTTMNANSDNRPRCDGFDNEQPGQGMHAKRTSQIPVQEMSDPAGQATARARKPCG
jgi:hypothetical protein